MIKYKDCSLIYDRNEGKVIINIPKPTYLSLKQLSEKDFSYLLPIVQQMLECELQEEKERNNGTRNG